MIDYLFKSGRRIGMTFGKDFILEFVEFLFLLLAVADIRLDFPLSFGSSAFHLPPSVVNTHISGNRSPLNSAQPPTPIQDDGRGKRIETIKKGEDLLVVFGIVSFVVIVFEELLQPNGLFLLLLRSLLLFLFQLFVLATLFPLASLPVPQTFLTFKLNTSV
jgi:hypothetical protein